MAADVSSLHRLLSNVRGCRDDPTAAKESGGPIRPTAPITRDLLGVGGGSLFLESNVNEHSHQELDLDLHVPFGWEKCLDLKSGRVYLQRCNSPNTLDQKLQFNQTVPKLQDLNFPTSNSNSLLNLLDDSSLELKLVSSSPTSYQSVCTLDKVKSALQRAEMEPINRKRSSWWNSSLSPSYSSSQSSIKDAQEDEDKLVSSPVAAGCPGCLSYVLIVRSSPKCPRCSTVVPVPAVKKPCIDLNISI